MSVDEILTFGKRHIELRIKTDLQERLDILKNGLSITFVELQEVRPPEAVQSYFDDVINAQIDKKKYITTAESYYNENILKAHARANRIVQNALAYKQKVIAEATGESKRFLEQLIQARRDQKDSTSKSAKFCGECGTKIQKGDRFCTSCGSAL